MSNRFFSLAAFGSAAALVAAIAIVFLAPASAAAQTQPAAKVAAKEGARAGAKTWTPPRTPDGQPDLQGYFTNASATPLERPKELGSREFYTPEEAVASVKARVDQSSNLPTGPGTYSDVHYDDAQFGLEPNQSKVAANIRTSLITGPDGRIPPMLPEARKRQAERAAMNKGHEFDGPENRPLAERCIMMGTEGPPMMPIRYNSNLQIVQGKGYVAIMQEMIHDVRVIPTDGSPHLPSEVRQLMGDSRGHWEGNTLVVDTTNFTDRTAFRGSSENMHLVERFTRTDADTVTYQFTVSDPSTWEKSWSAEIPMTKIDGPIFEYACHEGNYGMRNNLTGARAEEREKAAGHASLKP
jgi:hypothetical protein